MTLGLQAVGLLEDRTPHVVADVLQLLALDDVAHGTQPPITFSVATATWVQSSRVADRDRLGLALGLGGP